MMIHKPKLANKQGTGERIHVITKSTLTLLPHHISIVLFTPVNYPGKIHTDTLLEMEENPFFAIEQPNITIVPALQKLDNRTPDKFMAITWNQGGDSISIKRKTNIRYMKESDYIEKSQSDQQENIVEIAEISQDKLPHMSKKSAFTFHHNFYPNQM